MEAIKNDDPALSPQQKRFTKESKSALALYRETFCHDGSLLYYEACQFFLSSLPGLPGYGLRQIFYPRLLKSCGRKPALGARISLRNPGNISFGNKVLIDDDVAFSATPSGRIDIGDYVSIGRLSTLVARDSYIACEAGVNIGSYCRIGSQAGIRIGESTLIAAYCYIGPANHRIPQADEDVPLIEAGMALKGGVKIGKGVWIGAHSTILDGVEIGDGAVIGAHSLVRENVAANTIVVGSPAKVLRKR